MQREPQIVGDPRGSLSPRHPGAVTRRRNGRSVLRGRQCLSEETRQPGPNQVLTTPDFPGPRQTSPEIRAALKCTNRTQCNTVRRNPAVWHEQGEGRVSLAPRRAMAVPGRVQGLSRRSWTQREIRLHRPEPGIDRGEGNPDGVVLARSADQTAAGLLASYRGLSSPYGI
jgi:hypothetical protein